MSDRLRLQFAKYKTTNWWSYNQALYALMIWLGCYRHCSGFLNAPIQFCQKIKCSFGLAFRQAVGMVESVINVAGLSWSVMIYRTVCWSRKTLKDRIPYRPDAQPLSLLVDSACLEMNGEGEWNESKHGAAYWNQWRKLYIRIDAQSSEIRYLKRSRSNRLAMSRFCLARFGQINPNVALLSVSGDYTNNTNNTKVCYGVIALRELKRSCQYEIAGKHWKETCLEDRFCIEFLRATQRLSRVIWNHCSGYYRLSLVKAKIQCVRLMSEPVMALNSDRHVAEPQVRAAILNRFANGHACDVACGINPFGVMGRTSCG